MEVRIKALRRPAGCVTSLRSLREDHWMKETANIHKDMKLRASKTYMRTLNACRSVDMIWDTWSVLEHTYTQLELDT